MHALTTSTSTSLAHFHRQRYRYLLTIIDRFTRWPQVIPLSDITAESIACAFISNWIYSFGVPSTITTDRGAQFESSLFTQITSLLGIKRIRTTVYHPCANGMIERFHRQLKSSIKAYPDSSRWTEILPFVLLSIRNTVKADIDCTPSQLVFGTSLRLPGQLITPDTSSPAFDPTSYADRLQSAMQSLKPTSPRPQITKSYLPQALHNCTHVFIRTDAVRKPLEPPYTGPFKILRRHTKHFTILMHGKEQTISIDRLKPAYLDIDLLPSPAVPTAPTSSSILPVPATTPGRTTRSGRRVHFPDRL
eukprot:gene12966-biopygen3121